MIKILLYPTAPPLDEINSLLKQCGQEKYDFSCTGTNIKRWLGATHSPSNRDYALFHILGIGVPTLLDDLSTLLQDVGYDLGGGVRLYACTLSLLEARTGMYLGDKRFKPITEQLSNLIRAY